MNTASEDTFSHIGAISEASLIALGEAGLLSDEMLHSLASALIVFLQDRQKAGSSRPGGYLEFEVEFSAAAGLDASVLHVGRSRQDIASTMTRLRLRGDLLAALDAMNNMRGRMIDAARRNKSVVVPAFTNGVQAQPTTLGHYLLAFASAFDRSYQRLQAAFESLNLCPLGAAALSTSGYPIDRRRLASLLGFEGVVENSFDANYLSSIDTALEIAAGLGISMVAVCQFAQDLAFQYGFPKPWISLPAGPLTGISSLMPHKRNPFALSRLRQQSSTVLGDMEVCFLRAHNVTSGMLDFRDAKSVPLSGASDVFVLLGDIVGEMTVDAANAIDVISADYSTASELADALVREGKLTFRSAHSFISKLVDHARSTGNGIDGITFETARQRYVEQFDEDFPIGHQAYDCLLNPADMILGRRGLGGPQPQEMERMLAVADERLHKDRRWQACKVTECSERQKSRSEAVAALARCDK